MEQQRRLDKKRLARLAAGTVSGIVVGLLAALRFVHTTPRDRIPTEGLLGIGVFFTVGGLVYLIPGVWSHVAGRSTWSGKTVFGEMPPRDSLPAWRRALWDLQLLLVARDRRRLEVIRRDPHPSQLRASAGTLALGITLLLYAAFR